MGARDWRLGEVGRGADKRIGQENGGEREVKNNDKGM